MWDVIKFDNVNFSYHPPQFILDRVSFSIKGGSFYYLTGNSGSGKSSLIKLIYGGLRHFEGTVEVLNHSLAGLKRQDLCFLRQQMGVVFQDFNLINDLSVVENVALPLRIKGGSWRNSINRAKEVLNWIGFEESFQILPKHLSGGQQQRAVVARAIINEPRILLADEATGNLDDDNAVRLMEVFKELNQKGTTILFATHNHGLIRLFPYPALHVHNRTVTEKPAFISTLIKGSLKDAI